MTTTQRLVNLDVNDNGSWRRVASFDLDTFEDGDLEHCAHSLLALSTNKRLKGRLIAADGGTAPLMTWTHMHGWREWKAAA